MRTTFKQGPAVFIPLFFVLYFSAYSQENYANWIYSKNIVINTSSTGYALTTDVTNFPYLIRVSGKTFDFAQARGRGQDIRFANSAGAHLSYQIARWDSAGRQAVIWVRVDRILGNNSTQYVTMYWGRVSAPDSSSGSRVFSAQNGFAAVYHLEEAAGNALDATANALSATPNGNVPNIIGGIAGNSQSFDGDGDYYDAGNGAPFNMSAIRTFTVSAWVNRQGASINQWEGIATKFEFQTGNYREWELMYNGEFTFNISSDGTGGTETVLRSGAAAADNAWYYVTAVMDGQNAQLYVNGEVAASAAKTAVFNSANANFLIGAGDQNQAFNGKIDEVMVSRVARSADWIRLCYLNQGGFDTPMSISYPKKDFVFVTRMFIDSIIPSCDGVADSFTVTPMLPLFLAFNPANGVITGWAMDTISKASYIIRAYNRGGVAEDTISVTVILPVGTLIPPAEGALNAGPEILGAVYGQSSPGMKVLYSLRSVSKVNGIRFNVYDLKGNLACSIRQDCRKIRAGGVQSVQIPNASGMRQGIYLLEIVVSSSSGVACRCIRSLVVARF